MMEDDLLKYLGGDPRLEEKPTSQVHSPEYVGNYFANLYIRRLLLHHNFTQPNAALMLNAQCCSFTTNKLAKKSRKNIGLMSKKYISKKKKSPLYFDSSFDLAQYQQKVFNLPLYQKSIQSSNYYLNIRLCI